MPAKASIPHIVNKMKVARETILRPPFIANKIKRMQFLPAKASIPLIQNIRKGCSFCQSRPAYPTRYR